MTAAVVAAISSLSSSLPVGVTSPPIYFFFFKGSGPPRVLPSFPPRRSSDLDPLSALPARGARPARAVPARHPRRTSDRGQVEHGPLRMEPRPPQDPRRDPGRPGPQEAAVQIGRAHV